MNRYIPFDVKSAPPKIQEILRAAGYRKKTARYCVCDSVTLSGAYWSGGSRSQYSKVAPVNSRLSYPIDPPQFGGGDAPTIELKRGEIVLQTGIFCGKPAQAYLYMTAETATDYGVAV